MAIRLRVNVQASGYITPDTRFDGVDDACGRLGEAVRLALGEYLGSVEAEVRIDAI